MKQRIQVIDGLRGFALLGILVANMLHFQFGINTYDQISPDTWWDQAAFYFTKIFVEGSFYPIFGFLFGYSVILFVQSFENRGMKATGSLWRRALALIVLGFLHSIFIWDGDILLIYGLGLIIFMLFIKRQAKTVAIWSAVLFTIMLPFAFVKGWILQLASEEIVAVNDIFSNGSYLDILKHRLGITPEILDPITMIFVLIIMPIALFFVGVFSAFLIGPAVLAGMASAKVSLFEAIESKKSLLKRFIWFIPIGLTLKSAIALDSILADLLFQIGGSALAIGYIALFALLFIAAKESSLAKAFANLGKMSLTNYLLQSIICTTIFYGYGLGLFGKLGVLVGLGIAFVVFALQLLASNLYMKRFRSGPVEKLVRMFVYLGNNK